MNSNPYKMIVYFNMLHSKMHHRVNRQVSGIQIVTIQGKGWGRKTPSSNRRDYIHRSLLVALARALYSASVLDLAIASCFFKIQEMRFFSKKCNTHWWIFDH